MPKLYNYGLRDRFIGQMGEKMAKPTSRVKKLVITTLLVCLPGCATLAPLVVSGVGSGATYSLFSTAYKTETYPLKNVYRACLQALRTMAIKVHTVERNGEEIQVKGRAGKRRVVLDLETVTSATTNVTINVSKNVIFKDKATAEEIVYQVALALKRLQSRDLKRKATLAVSGAPPQATIRILNIRPRFYQGMVLSPGAYELSVSAKNHRNRRVLTTLRPGQDKIVEIVLSKVKK